MSTYAKDCPYVCLISDPAGGYDCACGLYKGGGIVFCHDRDYKSCGAKLDEDKRRKELEVRRVTEIKGRCKGKHGNYTSDDAWQAYVLDIPYLLSQLSESDKDSRTSGEWVRVESRLPESRRRVLVSYTNECGARRIEIACYIPPRTVRAEDFLSEDYAEGCEEYDEENDCFWVIEGWWEDSSEAEINWQITSPVTHWAPLPEPPSKEW